MQLETLIEQDQRAWDDRFLNALQHGGPKPPKNRLDEPDIAALNLLLAKRIGTDAQRNALLRVIEAATKDAVPVHFPSKKLFRNIETTANSLGTSVSIT